MMVTISGNQFTEAMKQAIKTVLISDYNLIIKTDDIIPKYVDASKIEFEVCPRHFLSQKSMGASMENAMVEGL